MSLESQWGFSLLILLFEVIDSFPLAGVTLMCALELSLYGRYMNHYVISEEYGSSFYGSFVAEFISLEGLKLSKSYFTLSNCFLLFYYQDWMDDNWSSLLLFNDFISILLYDLRFVVINVEFSEFLTLEGSFCSLYPINYSRLLLSTSNCYNDYCTPCT